jgi:hypothetical protein
MRRGTTRGYVRALRGVVLACIIILSTVMAVPSMAGACSIETEEVRQKESYAYQLPDCRAYEQVSPVDKNATDAAGKPRFVQSSPSGNSVTYYSVVPFPGLANASEFPTYLSRREGNDWFTQGLLPPAEVGNETTVLAVTEDNGESVVSVGRQEGLLLAPGAEAGRRNDYVHDSLTGEYKLLGAGVASVNFADSTPDGSLILFTSTGEELVPGIVDESGEPYLYEWERADSKILFVGSVNGEAPKGGTVAGSNEHEGEETYNQNTLSENGSRIFFSEKGEKKQIYMTEPGTSRTVEVSLGPAQWRAATPSGSRAFYTEQENLYEYNMEGASPARVTLTAGNAEVLGVVGISNDGSYAYFVAGGVLPGENENAAKEAAVKGAHDLLYEWHEGMGTTGIKFIGALEVEDEADWLGFVGGGVAGPDQGAKAARVTPDGTKMLFGSTANLTNYNSAGNSELYLYDATKPLSATNPACVSCNPRKEPATGSAFLGHNVLNASPIARNAFLTRNLVANGTRVFFQSEEALVPQANTQMNVYEWEEEGVGSCLKGTSVGNGGCIYLLSSGKSTSESYFGDASADGSNVFFFTRQSLVGQDQDNNVDIYDAREEGGLKSQNIRFTSPCDGEACRGQSGGVSVFGVPTSATFTGAGNVIPVKSKPFVESKAYVLPNAQKLVKALRICRDKPKRQRASCRRRAQKKYGTKAKRGNRRGR